MRLYRCRRSVTHSAFDLHALHVLLLWVLQYNVRQVCPWYQTLNVVGQVNHHAVIQQN